MNDLTHRVRPFNSRTALSKPLLLVALLGGSHAYSASLTWSGSVDNNWDTATANWTGSTWNNATPDSAIFDATGVGAVNLTTGITANGITFNTAGYTIAGSSLALTGTVATNASATINSAISAGATVFTAAASQVLTLGGAISGAGSLNFNGAGTVTLTGTNTNTGFFYIGQSGGATTVSINNGAQLGNGSGGSNYIAVQKGGTLRYTGTTATSTTNTRDFYTNDGAANVDITEVNGQLTILAGGGGTHTGGGGASPGTFTKSGAGTLAISSSAVATRNFLQPIAIAGGVLELNNNGTGAFFTIQRAMTGSAGTTLRVSGVGRVGNDQLTANYTGNLAGLDVVNGGTFDIRGQNVVFDALTGTGTLGNSYLTHSFSVGVNNGSGTFSGNIVSNSNGATLLGPSLITTGGLNLIKVGTGTQTLTGSNSYLNTTVSGGILSVGVIADAGTSNLGTGSVTLNGGKLQYTAVGATTTTTRAYSANNTTAGNAIEITDVGTTLAINSGFVGNGAGVVTKQGPGTLNLTGTADDSALVVNVAAGTLLLDKTGASIRAVAAITDIATGATVKLTGSGTDQIYGLTSAGTSYGLVNMSGGTLDLFGHSESLNRLTGTGTVTSNTAGDVTLTLGQSNATNAFGGTIENGSGTVALTKIGTGILTLSGANSYGAGTMINAGTLLADNTTGSATGTGAVTVHSTATLGGMGTISGDVTVETGGTIAPGGSVGTLATGALTISGGTLATEIDSSGSPTADLVEVTGDVDLDGPLVATDIAGNPAIVTLGTKLTLITYTGNLTGTFDGLAEEATVVIGSNTFKIRYDDSNAVTIEALAPVAGYSSWASINAPSQTPDQDFDNDGIANGVEYVLGGLATSQDAGKAPTASVSGGNLVFTFLRDRDSRTPDTDVFIDVGTTLAAWPLNFTVGDVTGGGVTVIDNLDGTDTVTLTVPQTPDTAKFARLRVEVTP
ncbi:autotransporter-associated beta strand repeat-containing protein [Luteolibacter arcticus]|uniref:Autotransporter-associated beta strand repeat-containing protein n=1 Tax=Luteolibacter arcticus TaxID=1581411 RepID=A0ABT3GQE8_9BACT|nr:autotransporter-associated beta strand repeat-containing protein [Luteolibacter arcticus]MCW1925704.1 autotransporter-associated beta strand repeat-containing protein [Luteolibacter arcticus]